MDNQELTERIQTLENLLKEADKNNNLLFETLGKVLQYVSNSNDPITTHAVYYPPSVRLRMQADYIEEKDRVINAARVLLNKCRSSEIAAVDAPLTASGELTCITDWSSGHISGSKE